LSAAQLKDNARPAAAGRARRFSPGLKGLGQRVIFLLGRILIPIFVRLRVENAPPFEALGPVILAPNHVSFIDPPVLTLACRRHITFLMTELFYQNPFTRWFFKLWEIIPVPEGRVAATAIKSALAALGEGRPIGIFPEGRISDDGCLNEGRGGVVMLLLKAQAPVIPVAILGTYDVLPRHRRWPRRARVTVRFGEPILPPPEAENVDPKAFATRIMSAIAALGAPTRAERLTSSPET
jgi:1-acyl-sn-glycerol-3-phosphate acyltransferase